jgi:hypothetical protein
MVSTTFVGDALPSKIEISTLLSLWNPSTNSLGRRLPTELGLLTQLKVLLLDTNYFEELVPLEIGLLTSIAHWINSCRGTGPSDFGRPV